ncbi:hypothetical protein DXG01_005007 [Tephrocybe rancida]|nr:hypothetical protein DXG01_005007 [Tephrocybe rancida]
MSSAVRRTASTRTAPKRTAAISIDKLAEQLTSGLVMSDVKGKRKAANVSEEQLRLESMRVVNSASQALSSAIQSGWKKSSGKPSSSVASAVTAAAKHLKVLRPNERGDVDVERAAMSVLGKLVALEMFDEAHSALEPLHSCLCTLLNVITSKPTSHHLIVIPLPTSEAIDTTLLTLTTTYLAYSLTIHANITPKPSKNSKEASTNLDSLSHALSSGETSLLAWIPRCSALPAKQLDSVLTRAYTALTKACMMCKTNSRAVFSLRMYAVACLALTSAGTVEATTFWDQVVRFGGAFVKSRELEEEEMMRVVLAAFSDLVRVVEERNDAPVLLSGKGFVGFCEYWLAFGKKAGDICLVDRIAGLIQGISVDSSSSSKAGQDTPILEGGEGPPRSKTSVDRDTLEAARLCATLAQTTSAFEQRSPDVVARAQEALSILKESTFVIRLLRCTCDNDSDYVRISGKLDRALERTRRAAISALDTSSKPPDDAFFALLEAISDVLAQQCSFPNADADILTRSLDTLFVLARTRLIPADPRTYIPAHDFLTKATTLIEPRASDPDLDVPNYLRCISGAFHNVAGIVYQAGRYGSAVGFLKDACSLGVHALETRRNITASIGGKAEEGWKQLDEQLYRRWELLGVCYQKNGDRKQALGAFRHCIKTFPYTICGFSQRIANTGVSSAFELSSATKQLATIIDRVTHLSACELLMESSAVSLKSLGLTDAGVTGVLLERQIESLESARWKDGVPMTISHLLHDTLDVYGPEMPVRRVRVLLKCLELMYHSGPNMMSRIGSPEETGAEVEKLLQDGDLKQDQGLAVHATQYRVTAHLWRALHAHRRVDAKQSELVAHYSEEACRLLKTMLSSASEPASAKKPLSKQIVAPKKPALGPPTRQRPTRKASMTCEPVTPKSKSRKVLHPISLNIQTPPRQSANTSTSIAFDDIEKLIALFQLTARISGILAQILPKIHLLDGSRKLCDIQLGKQSDGYIISSVDLAYEYVKLGKMRRATTIFVRIVENVNSGKASPEASAYFFLRYAESLVATENVSKSINIYSEALNFSEVLDIEDKGLPTLQRIRARVKRLEMAAIASHVFAIIQYSKEDVPAALDSMLQALRLWNRATESLLRLASSHSSSPASQGDNPFEMTSLKDALLAQPSKDALKELPPSKKIFPRRTSMDGLEWRMTEGLITTLFSLVEVYMNRGSVREAEYFAQQAQDLAESLNAPTLVSRALAKKGEIQLYQGHLETSLECLTTAATLLEKMPGVESIDVRRLRGIYNERMAHVGDASTFYEESLDMIDELEEAFQQIDNLVFSRKSIGSSPGSKAKNEVVLPRLLAAVLRQRIWLLRDGDVEDYSTFLEKFLSLPHSYRTKSDENALMAKLTLHAVYGRFRADMFLSSLTESTIALPMGMSNKSTVALLPATQDILMTLEAAEKLFWENLTLIAKTGNITDVREAVVSLALVHAFQTSLGKSRNNASSLTARLLDVSAAITLRQEMLETINHKFPPEASDDIKWPLIAADGSVQPRLKAKRNSHFSFDQSLQAGNTHEEADSHEVPLKDYWASVRTRYQSQTLDPSSLALDQVTSLPNNWTVIHINVTEDKSTLFITRRECGSPADTPLIFCVPLNGRRGNSEDDEQHLTFQNAVEELKEIVRLSDEGTKAAVHVKSENQEERAKWWKDRAALDMRLQKLLENIEFCWLGAFKTILNPRPNLTSELVTDLRAQFEKVFHRALHIKDKKTKPRTGSHKKSASQSQSPAPSQVTFDDTLLKCFSTLSPKCQDEELEDLVYFILDLYQFHGVPVAIAEVDIFQVVVDLRTVLEDHAQKLFRRNHQKTADEHLFLVLDKNLQGLPWESMPILRSRSVSRVPSVDFLHDRVQFADWKRKAVSGEDTSPVKGAVVDPRKGYYILNPSGDLNKTEARFKGWAADMEKAGWEGISGHAPSEQQFLNALQSQDLVVYFGHGGGEQYLRSHKIRNLPVCAATMLWGCSSGALREMGDFDRVGTPYNYMLAGSPCLVANLWDVTDRDIDKFSQSVFDRLGLTAAGTKRWGRKEAQVSIVDAVGQSRDSCKLKYLTGAAPIVYGIPFYL